MYIPLHSSYNNSILVICESRILGECVKNWIWGKNKWRVLDRNFWQLKQKEDLSAAPEKGDLKVWDPFIWKRNKKKDECWARESVGEKKCGSSSRLLYLSLVGCFYLLIFSKGKIVSQVGDSFSREWERLRNYNCRNVLEIHSGI